MRHPICDGTRSVLLRFLLLLVVGLFFAPACLFAAGSETNGLMRIVAPVRLSAELGAQLDDDVQKTLEILERFQNGGFEYAVWAVDSLPKKQKDMKKWTETCLKAFPDKVILALDSKLENGSAVPNPDALKPFLKQVLPEVDSVLVNYEHLNNCEVSNDTAKAVEAVRANAQLVQEIAPKMFVWLLVHDCSGAVAGLPEWTEQLSSSADGYFVYRVHAWNMKNVGAAEQLLKTGKPVVRAGFQYTCPTPRPGIEKEIEENYRQRMAVYEKWISQVDHAGYCRELGAAIPSSVNASMMFVEVNEVE